MLLICTSSSACCVPGRCSPPAPTSSRPRRPSAVSCGQSGSSPRQRILPLLLKHRHMHRDLLIRRRMRCPIDMAARQLVHRLEDRVHRHIQLLALHAVRHQNLHLEPTIRRVQLHIPARLDPAFLRQLRRNLNKRPRRNRLDPRPTDTSCSLLKVLQQAPIIQVQIVRRIHLFGRRNILDRMKLRLAVREGKLILEEQRRIRSILRDRPLQLL